MPSSLPRINLSGLLLTSAYLARWPALKHAPQALDWYLSFDREPGKAEELLAGVRSLDLSENRLEGGYLILKPALSGALPQPSRPS